MGDYTQVPTPPADPVATASAQPDFPISDPNRPIFTIPADSPQATPSAQPKPADPVDQVFEASASAKITPPADLTVTASGSEDLQPTVPISPQSPAPLEVPVQAASSQSEPQSPPVFTPSEVPKVDDIQDHSPSNPPSQVQPEAPKNTPVIHVENIPSQSAGIKPEPLEGTQNTISADPKPPESPKSSFGDLMGTPAELSEEPAIHIDPIEAPTTPPVFNEKEASAIHRQRAVEARKQKREENLAKILELAQKKGTIDNLDVRDFLHISQTTATDYLHTLVNSGKLKKEGKAKATVYSL